MRTEILRMGVWFKANPSKLRADKEMMRFITGWLFRENDRKHQPVIVSMPSSEPAKQTGARFSDLTPEDLKKDSFSTFGGIF